MRTIFAALAIVHVLYVGDSFTCSQQNYLPADTYTMKSESLCSYHVADSILAIEDRGWYNRIVIQIGIHAARSGSDRLYKNDPDLFRRRYGQLLDVAQAHSAEVVVIGLPWTGWPQGSWDRAVLFNQIMREEALSRNIYFVDLWSILEECGPSCIGPDCFHPSGAGYEMLRSALPPIQHVRITPIGVGLTQAVPY